MDSSFIDLGVNPYFIRRLAGRNITEATDIQKRVIPLLAAGESVFFCSATGTGKTFAYLLPLAGRLLASQTAPDTQEPADVEKPAVFSGGPWPRLVIAAPTFELCSQIKAEADFLLGAGNAALAIGSANISRQIESLKKERPAVIVGNPGRLLLLAKMGKLKFRGLDFLVMDEADRLVSDEMSGETAALCEIISRDTRGGNGAGFVACSATLAEKSREKLLALPLFARNADNGNVRGAVKFIETAEHEILRQRIEHWAVFSESRRKIITLRSLIAAVRPAKALIFSSRTDDAAKIAAALQYHKINSGGLYSGMDKKKRKGIIDSFRSGKIAVLVSSDLSARGLDIPGITHIIALDVPADKDSYIHRAGRTGRAGKRGIMISVGDEPEMRRLAALEKKLGIIVRPKELYGGKLCAPEV